MFEIQSNLASMMVRTWDGIRVARTYTVTRLCEYHYRFSDQTALRLLSIGAILANERFRKLGTSNSMSLYRTYGNINTRIKSC